ncbi:MAG: thioredoxin domain-containing protein [Candidatus Limnocylindria bacterium]
MPNRLAQETSPYLLQHANNPVDWFPWGPDALARAKLLDRPIFLSIGYAACHWCHVMERESFEREETARILNARFVSIKVDREERPDLDSIYMSAVQAMTGSGGWPMSVFLTPDGAPFYGGTYFPDQPRHGMPSFEQVLDGVWQAWTTQRSEVLAAGQRMVSALIDQSRAAAAPVAPAGDASSALPDATTLLVVDAALAERFDQREGSWGGAPKFPQPMTIEYLLGRLAAGAGATDGRLEAMVRFTLDRMADGGIRDQLGGGFHRYATDAHWLVPHFEQMLYDNAQLARAYLHAGVLLDDPWYREVATGVLEYLVRELRTDDGAFASSQDADTDGEEGRTFTWRADEIRAVLGDDAPPFTAAYGVTDDGNWEGVTILSRVTDRGPAGSDGERRLADARARLLAHRRTRPQPARDDKALAAWNGLAIAAFADAGRLLGEARYTAAAATAADTILAGLLADDGSLRRSWKDGRAVGQGVLEDHSHLAEGLLALYAATFDERWYRTAVALMDRVLTRFADPAGGFFDTADDHERLITRPRDVQDNAVPSGAAMATTVLLRLAALSGEGRYRDAAERAIGTVRPYLARYPTGFAQWLVAVALATAEVREVAIIGDPTAPGTRALLEVVDERWRPDVLAALAPDDAAAAASAVPLLHDRVAIDGRPTAYVCRGFVCDLPVTDPDALRDRLRPASA